MGIDILLDNVKRDAISKFDATKPSGDIFEAISLVYRLAIVARKEGFLALEETVYSIAGDMHNDIIAGIQLLVDGTKPELLTEIITNEYWRDKYQGNDALKKYILMRGTLLIQLGTNPRILQDILIALLPQQLQPVYKEYFDNHRADWEIEDETALKARYEKWNERKLDAEDINEVIKEVENKFINLDNRGVQRVLRDISDDDLAAVMSVFTEEGRNKIFKNVSERCKIILMEDVMAWRWKETFISDAVKRVAEVISHLEYTGEIIFVLA